MKLLPLFLFAAFCVFTTARHIPPSLPRLVDVSRVTTEVEQIHRPIDFSTGADKLPADAEPADPEEDAIWCKSLGRGRMFIDAMKLNEADAAKLLGWPHVQSTWDGPLYDELRKWGYLDSESVHQQSDSSCDFGDFETAFKVLGVDVRSAGAGGPNHCFHFSHGYSPAMELDANGKMPKLPKQMYVVNGVRYPATGGSFLMGANPKDGVIYFLDRRSPQTSLRSLSRNRYDPSKLPQLRSSSDIAWAIWNRVAVSNMKNVKMFMSRDIVNDDTERIIHRILRKQFGLEKVKAWPGVDFEITWEPGREAETEAALALIGSPNGMGAGYFLTQHKRQLGTKTISKVKVFINDSAWPLPQMIFFVEDVSLHTQRIESKTLVGMEC